jgi:hypothetical protein
LCRDGRIEHEGTPGVTPTANCDFQGDGLGESNGRFRGLCLHGLKALEPLGVASNLKWIKVMSGRKK